MCTKFRVLSEEGTCITNLVRRRDQECALGNIRKSSQIISFLQSDAITVGKFGMLGIECIVLGHLRDESCNFGAKLSFKHRPRISRHVFEYIMEEPSDDDRLVVREMRQEKTNRIRMDDIRHTRHAAYLTMMKRGGPLDRPKDWISEKHT